MKCEINRFYGLDMSKNDLLERMSFSVVYA